MKKKNIIICYELKKKYWTVCHFFVLSSGVMCDITFTHCTCHITLHIYGLESKNKLDFHIIINIILW